jgi:hypothetical protein
MREAGLKDYLVLLSICQTCKCRGISFLKFLLSRERDMDAFGAGSRPKRLPTIEIYPKGFSTFKFSQSVRKVSPAPERPDEGESQSRN